MQSIIFAVLGLLAATVGTVAPSIAATLTVSPLRVDLAVNRPTAAVELRNAGATSTLVQVETFTWIDGAVTDGLPPADDLLAMPPVFELAPGATQVIRVGLRRPPEPGVERAYRLVIGEVPSAVEAPPGGLAFVLNLNLPVFVTPANARPAPEWTARAAAGGGGELRLANAGAAHLALRNLRLADADAPRVLLEVEEPATVLAGGERRWRFDAGGRPLPRSVRVMADSDGGAVDVVVPLQGG